MPVITELRFSPTSFEMGRVLSAGDGGRMELERLVPLGTAMVPFVWVDGPGDRSFEAAVRKHRSVEDFQRRQQLDGLTLYELTWATDGDALFKALTEVGASLLRGVGGEDGWQFEIRFPDRESLATFQHQLTDAGIRFEIETIYDAASVSGGNGSGVTGPQREALVLAAERGYFDVPRRISTKELGEELGISDQAVTERLRRGISALVAETVQSGPANGSED